MAARPGARMYRHPFLLRYERVRDHPCVAAEAIATTLLRSEALGSSFIEGLRASNRQLALAAHESVAADPTARSVLGNVRAMERAIEIGIAPRRIRLDDVLDIHRTLLEGTTEARFAGIVRMDQNWIGGRGTSPRDATFVPTPPDRVPALLDDLVAFVKLDDLPAISQAAIAHAQFETVHPFADGNGRAGRCLIQVILRRRGVASRLVPPISVVLATNAERYIAELVRRAGTPRTDSVARKTILGLPQQPVVNADVAASAHAVTPTAARAALNRLQEAGVLVPTRVGRRGDREWISDELFQLLDAFEQDLGE